MAGFCRTTIAGLSGPHGGRSHDTGTDYEAREVPDYEPISRPVIWAYNNQGSDDDCGIFYGIEPTEELKRRLGFRKYVLADDQETP